MSFFSEDIAVGFKGDLTSISSRSSDVVVSLYSYSRSFPFYAFLFIYFFVWARESFIFILHAYVLTSYDFDLSGIDKIL